MERVTVAVALTTVDVDIGFVDRTHKNCYTCPVAMALLRATGREWNVSSTHAYCRRSNIPAIPLPVAAVTFIAGFDAQLRMEPIAFDFEIPRECMA